MGRSTKGLQYKYTKEREAWIFYFFFYMSLLEIFLFMFDYLQGEEIAKDIIYEIILEFAGSVLGMLYIYSTKIKAKIVTHYGVGTGVR